MFITKKHLSRRTVLRGAGTCIALPLLDAMIPALARASTPAPHRMAFVGFPMGAVIKNWSPEATGKDFKISPILEPLDKYREYLTIVSGLRNKPAESPEPHAYIERTWLSCVSAANAGVANPDSGVSADQFAARHIGQDTRIPSLELCTALRGAQVAWRTPKQSLPQEGNPRAVFYKLFGQGDTDAERKAILNETGSLLDRVTDEVQTLDASLGGADRAAVDDYLGSVREIERRVQMASTADTSALEIPDAPIGVPNDIVEHMKLMFDLMGLAFQADLTRVITLSLDKEASMRSYQNLGISEAFHPLSHHGNIADKQEKLTTIQNFHTKMFAGFVEKLATAKEADGTVLDHSTIVYGSNMSDSNRHNNDPLPTAILGRAHGRIKGGQHVRYPQDSRFADLLVTLFDRAQIPVESIGDSGGLLSEV
jgi:Protein of unknown function (DUF1552)